MEYILQLGSDSEDEAETTKPQRVTIDIDGQKCKNSPLPQKTLSKSPTEYFEDFWKPKPIQNVNSAPAVSLNNKSFQKMVANHAKPRNVVVNCVVNDENLEALKALTDPENKSSKDIKSPVNNTCRKKHHITYLAQQAKATEEEFKNQWAQSKYTRDQTRAKYGF